jgi:hypothetical protein
LALVSQLKASEFSSSRPCGCMDEESPVGSPQPIPGLRRGHGIAINQAHRVCALQPLIALKGAIEKAGKVDKEASIDAIAGLVFASPTGPVTTRTTTRR